MSFSRPNTIVVTRHQPFAPQLWPLSECYPDLDNNQLTIRDRATDAAVHTYEPKTWRAVECVLLETPAKLPTLFRE